VSDAPSDDVLSANDRFYVAFATRDAASMEELWAQDAQVACVHPGWPPIRGRSEVLASWRSIFDHDEGPTPTCETPTADVHGDVATVLCRERLGNVVLIATNVFVREAGQWRITHHHSSALARIPPTPPMDPELLPN
jgi:ketosteroid isomerase-like protein